MAQAAATLTACTPLREALARIGPLFVSQQAAESCITRGIRNGVVRFHPRWRHPAVAAALGVDIADIISLGARFDQPRGGMVLTLQIPTTQLPDLPADYPVQRLQVSGIDFVHAPGFVEVELIVDIEVAFDDVEKLLAPGPAQPAVLRPLRALLEDLDHATAGEEPVPKAVPVTAKAWLAAAVERKKARDVPKKISHFAQALHREMTNAAGKGEVDRVYKTGKVIETRLHDQKLWPIK